MSRSLIGARLSRRKKALEGTYLIHVAFGKPERQHARFVSKSPACSLSCSSKVSSKKVGCLVVAIASTIEMF
jgi:hypothetical protein